MEYPCMWPCITPIDYFPMLDPTLKAPRASGFPTIRLLKNDNKDNKKCRIWYHFNILYSEIYTKLDT